MKKGKDVIGLPVLSYESGKRLANVREIVLDPKQRRVLAFLVGARAAVAEEKVIPFHSVKAIGVDAIIVPNEQAIVRASEVPEVETALRAHATIAGLQVFTEDGRNIGTIDDIIFDETTGELKGFEVSRGLLDRIQRGRVIIPVTPSLSIGAEVVFVPTETGARREEVRPGSEEILRRVRAEAQRLLDMATKATAEQQKRFVIGKIANRTVVGPDDVIIVSQGETIDNNIANDAERKGVLGELVLAVGTRVVMDVVRDLRGGAIRAVNAVRKPEQRRQPAKRQAETTEEARMNEILGRRVGRVVLDQDERVILNTGEMITHESIERARHAGVLDELYAAAWMGELRPAGDEIIHAPGELRQKGTEEAERKSEERR